MFSAKESLDDNQTKSNTEILLNSFLIRKKRYRVLLHLDKIIWEQENQSNYKNEVSVYDILSISKSINGKYKIPSTEPHNSTMSAFPNFQTTPPINQTISSTSGTFLFPSNSSIEPITPSAISAYHQNEFSNLAFQSNDEPTKYYQNIEIKPIGTTATTTTTTNINENFNQFYLIINYGKRLIKSQTDYNQWRKKTIILYNSDTNIINKWYSVLQQILIKQNRPKNLLIFINPYGGHQKGLKIYEKYCKPLFQLANIDCNCIISQRANQIRDIIMKQSLEQYDGICCVGGDGTFAEVFNGLIFRTIIDLNMNPLKPNYIPKPIIPIGIIPAGSTDTIVYCLHGTSDITTATIHIILGQKRGLDLSSVRNSNGLIRFYASVLSYGYLGDIALDSEKFRWMGPKRYEYSGFKKFFANRGYDGEIILLDSESSKELPSSSTSSSSSSTMSGGNSDTVPQSPNVDTKLNSKLAQNSNNSLDCSNNIENQTFNKSNSNLLNEKCYINCLHCSKIENLNLNEINQNSNNQEIIYNDDCDSTNNDIDNNLKNDKLHTASTSSTISLDIKPKEYNQKTNHDIDNQIQNQNETTINCDIKNENINLTKTNEELTPELISSDAKNWKNIKGKFFLISGANISCACQRSPNGLAPFSHLGDGYLDIILVRHTTFFNNIRLLLQMSNKNGDLSNLPFVEIHRTRKFLFRSQKSISSMTTSSSSSSNCQNPDDLINSSSSITSEKHNNLTSQWNCDGEVIHDSDVVITSHRQLIDTFMRGPYPIDDSARSSKCCGKF